MMTACACRATCINTATDECTEPGIPYSLIRAPTLRRALIAGARRVIAARRAQSDQRVSGARRRHRQQPGVYPRQCAGRRAEPPAQAPANCCAGSAKTPSTARAAIPAPSWRSSSPAWRSAWAVAGDAAWRAGQAVRRGADSARQALSEPREGTILSVIAAFADALEQRSPGRRSPALVRAALERTPARAGEHARTSWRCCRRPAWSMPARRASWTCSRASTSSFHGRRGATRSPRPTNLRRPKPPSARRTRRRRSRAPLVQRMPADGRGHRPRRPARRGGRAGLVLRGDRRQPARGCACMRTSATRALFERRALRPRRRRPRPTTCTPSRAPPPARSPWR